MATINESFDTTDSATLGPDLTWTELEGGIDVVSNKAQSTSNVANCVARAEQDLDINHYAEAVTDTSADGEAYSGILVRKDSSATLTFYFGGISWTEDQVFITKMVAGVQDNLALDARVSTAGTPVTIRLEARDVGADVNLKLFCNGVEVLDFTDTSSPITTGLRTGLWGFKGSSGAITWDDFEAGDLVAQVATPTIDPDGGSHVTSVEVTLACATAGATIYYATDGSTPDATDTEYTVPFTLIASATVKAIAIKATLIDSDIASAAFTITEAGTGIPRKVIQAYMRSA